MRTLYRATRVHTFASPRTGEWMLVDGRHVERVGTGDPPAADRVVELPGTSIIPGFVDAHVHLTGTGEHAQAPEVGAAGSAAELLDAVRVASSRREGPVMLHGYDESTWGDRAVPGISDLDATCDRPLLVLRIDGHVGIANTAAIKESGISDREGVELDEAGEPTGRLTRRSLDALRRWFSTHLAERDVEDLQLAAAGMAVSHGVTTIHEMSMPALRGIRDLEILLGHRSRLPVDVVTYVATTDIPQVMDLGLPRIGGDLPVDGSVGARTAFVSEAYVDAGGTGARYFDDDALAMFFHDGHLAGLQVGVHAIGDAAIEQVVSTWERVYQALDSRGRRHFRARRHRIEHFEMAEGPMMERAAALGLGIGVQPAFDAAWGFPGGLYEQGLGWERAVRMNRFRDLLERGLEVGVGSDTPITPLDPMHAVSAFEGHHDPAQRLSRMEALRACSLGGARLGHQGDKKGTLEPGKHADFAAYDVDPTDAADVAGVRPVLTVSLGRDVFAA